MLRIARCYSTGVTIAGWPWLTRMAESRRLSVSEGHERDGWSFAEWRARKALMSQRNGWYNIALMPNTVGGYQPDSGLPLVVIR